ncbi:MAG: DUF4406 domain-containing protein [Pseudobutyrivibrio ruminis]|nr:DUF4406 domain-containing protein [Pseudobutyrivibrio ruminis]
MRVYLSGPITGTTDYLERFDKAESELNAAGYKTINPARCNMFLPENTTHKEFMHICKAQIDLCDVMYMMNGWEKSNGCRQEFEYASRHGISITFEGGTCSGKQTRKSL